MSRKFISQVEVLKGIHTNFRQEHKKFEIWGSKKVRKGRSLWRKRVTYPSYQGDSDCRTLERNSFRSYQRLWRDVTLSQYAAANELIHPQNFLNELCTSMQYLLISSRSVIPCRCTYRHCCCHSHTTATATAVASPQYHRNHSHQYYEYSI